VPFKNIAAEVLADRHTRASVTSPEQPMVLCKCLTKQTLYCGVSRLQRLSGNSHSLKLIPSAYTPKSGMMGFQEIGDSLMQRSPISPHSKEL
jgi:hypothetical protein